MYSDVWSAGYKLLKGIFHVTNGMSADCQVKIVVYHNLNNIISSLITIKQLIYDTFKVRIFSNKQITTKPLAP